MNLKDFFPLGGQEFKILRNESHISTETGVSNHEKNTRKTYIGFLPETDVIVGDWLENSVSERFLVVDIKTSFLKGKPFEKQAFYITETESRQSKTIEPHTVFNIQSVTGSIVGNNNIATLNYQTTIQDLKDKAQVEAPNDEDLKKVINLLEMLVNEEVPAKQGLFSKFSHVFEKHSWLTGAVASAILNWLTTLQLP